MGATNESHKRKRHNAENAIKLFDTRTSNDETATPNKTTLHPQADKADTELKALKTIDIISFNARAEERFVALLATLVKSSENNEITIIEAIRECAFELDISTETAKRYLLKHTARHARFQIQNGKVRLRQ